jgi:hypothetical protein
MLNRRGDHMPPLTSRRPYSAENRQIIGFGSAADEGDFTYIASEQCRDFAARTLQHPLGRLTVLVDTGSVTEVCLEARNQRRHDLRRHGCCGVVVKIVPIHREISPKL